MSPELGMKSRQVYRHLFRPPVPGSTCKFYPPKRIRGYPYRIRSGTEVRNAENGTTFRPNHLSLQQIKSSAV